jgi:hypothetical protein
MPDMWFCPNGLTGLWGTSRCRWIW